MSYRPEIDGLRAIAVLSVIIYHAGIYQMSGGFIGVDIFYVISGYLITSIIITALQNKQFSFAYFYTRRIKRLLPAALIMLLCSVIFGAAILTTDKYIALAQSAIYSSSFIANFWFMNHSGYFDQATETSPLVHMWSLSLEEQFYLIFPLLIVSTYRFFAMHGVKILLLAIFTLSFLASIFYTGDYPNFAFYMLPTRAWELSIGAGITLLPQLKPNKFISHCLAISGILSIIFGLLTINENTLYPSFWAIFPTIGTALIIYSSSEQRNIVKSTLSLPPLIFIGKISYSAYLWHWPIIVYFRVYINERPFTYHETLSLICASLISGYLSWQFIEQRYRYNHYTYKHVFSYAACCTAVVIGISTTVYMAQGFPQRIPKPDLAMLDNTLMWEWQCTERIKLFAEIDESFCVIGKPWQSTSNKGIVWGDSHSQHWAPILHLGALENDMSLVIAPKQCPAYLNLDYIAEHYPKFPNFTRMCTQKNKLTFDLIKSDNDIKLVIMAAAWSGHIRMLSNDNQTTGQLSTAPDTGINMINTALSSLLLNLTDKSVLLLADFPRPNKVLNECAFANKTKILREPCAESQYTKLDTEQVFAWHKDSDSILQSMATKFAHVSALFPAHFLCDNVACQTYVNEELIYKDRNHIRRNLSLETRQVLAKELKLNEYFVSIQN